MIPNKNTTLPCIVCGKKLKDIGSGSINHPSEGISFSSPGQYGTTAFDPMDGSLLEINICDGCIVAAARVRRVLFKQPASRHIAQRTAKTTYWDGKG